MGYNTKGEVVDTNHNNNAFDKSQSFDGIGNRITATDATGVTNYTSNSLNQYSAVGTVARTHDDDGNTLGGVKTANGITLDEIKWNGNNRLTKVTTADGKLVQVDYDHMGRRIKKSVVGNGVTKRTAWVYSGYNAIAKYEAESNAALSLKKTYYWGGGLLAERDEVEDKTYFSLCDGNKNVTEFLDSTGAIAAHYEYDSFGKVLISSGTKKDQMDYGFSSEVNERDLGLVYYNYRYLNAADGSWLNRDPIGIRGGSNEYGFVKNDSVNYIDRYGLKKGKIVGWIVQRSVGGVKKMKPIYSKKILQESFKKGADVLVVGGRGSARKIAKKVIEKSKLLHHYGHKLKTGGKGLPHFQDDKISGKHIFYTAMIAASLSLYSEADAAEGVTGNNKKCRVAVRVDEVYTDYEKSDFHKHTFTYHYGEVAENMDIMNPWELVAAVDDIRLIAKGRELQGYVISVFDSDHSNTTPVGIFTLDANGEGANGSITAPHEYIKANFDEKTYSQKTWKEYTEAYKAVHQKYIGELYESGGMGDSLTGVLKECNCK